MPASEVENMGNTTTDSQKMAVFLFNAGLSDKLSEVTALLETAGYKIIKSYVIDMEFSTAEFFFTEDRCLMVKDEISPKDSDITLIVGHQLTARQHFNLEQLFEIESERLLDKIEIVLQIFLINANSEEANLQVKLAELRYRGQFEKMRMLAKLGTERKGMVDYIGPGESISSQFDSHLKRTESAIKDRLDKIRKTRATQRKRRLNPMILSIGLTGYTGSGKSTLLNAITNSEVQTSSNENKLFTTVGTRTRRVMIDDLAILITDTVGFVENLPPFMIKAFSSTLEELNTTDVKIIVIDGSESYQEVKRKLDTTFEVMDNIQADLAEAWLCINKCDRIRDEQTKTTLVQQLKLDYPTLHCFTASALRGQLSELYSMIDSARPLKHFSIAVTELSLIHEFEKFLYANCIVINSNYSSTKAEYFVKTRLGEFFKNRLAKAFPRLEVHISIG